MLKSNDLCGFFSTDAYPAPFFFLVNGSTQTQMVPCSLSVTSAVRIQGEAGLTDDRLAHALSNMPPRAFALLEDIDAAFVRRDAADVTQSRSYVTFSVRAAKSAPAMQKRAFFFFVIFALSTEAPCLHSSMHAPYPTAKTWRSGVYGSYPSRGSSTLWMA